MGLVLWIDQNTFATSLLEKVFKKKNLQFYTISSAVDFIYLVVDLKPELLVLDSKTGVVFQEALKEQYLSSEALRNLPVVMIDEEGEFPFIPHIMGKIKRPFDPFQIPEILQQIFKPN